MTVLTGSAGGLRRRLALYARLIRFDRPIGTLLLLWPALWALWLAGAGRPDPLVLGVFVWGVFLMRSAGCAINDYADRDIDPRVRRTESRPLAAGEIRPAEALGVFVVLALLAFALVLLMNRLTVALSLVAVLLAASYPFMKRYTHLPQAILGAAFGWAVPMAFAAQTGALPPIAWVLFFATLLWALVYDTQYAMVDREDDQAIGVKSSAILFGEWDRLIIGLIQVLVLLLLLRVGWMAKLGVSYYLGLGTGAGLFAWQQYLMREREPRACFKAFLNNNWFGLAVFAGLAVDYLVAG